MRGSLESLSIPDLVYYTLLISVNEVTEAWIYKVDMICGLVEDIHD